MGRRKKSENIAQITETERTRNYINNKNKLWKNAVIYCVVAVCCLILVPIFLFISIMLISPKSNPVFFGKTIYIVSSESMEPTFYKGNAVLIKSAGIDDISVESIITFEKKDGTTVTHKVVEIIEGETNTYYKTWGINNTNEDGSPRYDEEIVEFDDIVGIVKGKIFAVGEIISFFKSTVGIVVFSIIIAGFVFAIGLVVYKMERLESYKSNKL